MPTLNPSPPDGSIYFSQAHSLRWMTTAAPHPDLLYREILSAALFFEALIISDSYATANWEILNMLPGGRFSSRCSGIDELFRVGAIRVAIRQRHSLEEVVQGLIRRQVPTTVEGQVVPITGLFLPYAERLERLTEGYRLDYDPQRLELADLLLNEVLDRDSVSKAYGLATPKLRGEIGRVVDTLKDGKLLFAADLFNYPTKYPGLLSEGQNRLFVQRLATSAHNCNFPLTFGLLPLISPNSDDHEGSTALYEHFVPEMSELARKDDPLAAPLSEPVKLVPTAGRADIACRGIEPVLELRETPEFAELQQARTTLLTKYRDCRDRNDRTLATMEDRHAWTLTRYMAKIAEVYGITGDISKISSPYLSNQYFETKRQLEDAQAGFSRDQRLYTGLAAFATALVVLNIAPQVLLLATGAMWLGSYVRDSRIIDSLRQVRDTIEGCVRLINTAGQEDKPK